MIKIVQTSAPRLTPSSVADLRCPLKYKTLRIDQMWEKREVHLAVAHGKAVHAVIGDIYAARVGATLDVSNIESQARGAIWATVYPRDADREEQVSRVVRAARAFIDADDEEAIGGILDLERQGQFEIRMDGRVLCVMSAKLDCLLVRAAEPHILVIRERKTTAQRVDLKECYIQMRVAQKMHPDFELKNVVIEYDWLDEDGRVVRDKIAAEKVKGQHQIVLGLAYRVLTAAEYPAIPGDVCAYCPRREACQTLPADDYTQTQLHRLSNHADDTETLLQAQSEGLRRMLMAAGTSRPA